jgi:hypothetical protein
MRRMDRVRAYPPEENTGRILSLEVIGNVTFRLLPRPLRGTLHQCHLDQELQFRRAMWFHSYIKILRLVNTYLTYFESRNFVDKSTVLYRDKLLDLG